MDCHEVVVSDYHIRDVAVIVDMSISDPGCYLMGTVFVKHPLEMCLEEAGAFRGRPPGALVVFSQLQIYRL